MLSQDKSLMLKFLYRNYPVSKTKINNKFKRTIITDDGNIYLLSNKESIEKLYFYLFQVLNRIFYIDSKTIKDVLTVFLNLKKN